MSTGTGVRAEGYAATLAAIERQVAKHVLPLVVRGCYWGEAEGARLRAGGASIPGYAGAGGQAPSEADQLHALWIVLYTDPWYELRLLRHRPKVGSTPFGRESPSAELIRAVREYAPSVALRERFDAAGVAEYVDTALAELCSAP